MAKKLWATLRQRGRRGVAAVEFALCLPVWIALLLGVGDGTYYLLVNEKCDRIAYTVTDIVTQYQTISQANLNDIFLAAAQLMNPLPFGANGVVVVTSVLQNPTTGLPVIEWQRSGGGTLPSQISRIGAQGGTATLPNGLTLNSNDNIIISEVFYNFRPLFVDTFLASTIYRVAVYKPRLSPLVTPPT